MSSYRFAYGEGIRTYPEGGGKFSHSLPLFGYTGKSDSAIFIFEDHYIQSIPLIAVGVLDLPWFSVRQYELIAFESALI